MQECVLEDELGPLGSAVKELLPWWEVCPQGALRAWVAVPRQVWSLPAQQSVV